ncbi:acyl-CoA dehydrogenase family protein [Advenella kashmirensis]
MQGIFNPEQEKLIETVDQLVFSNISKRAAEYDRTGNFPDADFQDLHKAGLLLATLSKKDGGLGFGFEGDDPLSFFLIIERLAKGNASTAHCFQVHCNALQILRAFGSDEQVKRFTQPTVEDAKLFVGAGAEPGGTRESSTAKRTSGGYIINGMKHYATNATRTKWMTVHVKADDTGLLETFVVDAESPGLTIDESFWNPSGMRACVSPMLTFKDCFVPDECVLGRSGAFFSEHWLARINFGFTANYLGSLQAMYEWALNYVRQRGQVTNTVYLTHIGELKSRIDAARLLFYHAVNLTKINREAGLVKSNEAKWVAVDTVNRLIELVGQFVGSTAYFNQYPLERMVRDMKMHTLHRRHHAGAVLVAQMELGQECELNHS